MSNITPVFSLFPEQFSRLQNSVEMLKSHFSLQCIIGMENDSIKKMKWQCKICQSRIRKDYAVKYTLLKSYIRLIQMHTTGKEMVKYEYPLSKRFSIKYF